MLDYPEEFVQRVKALYPAATKLHEMLDKGDSYVGALLEDELNAAIVADVIMPTGALETLQALAEDKKARKEVFEEWEKICIAQHGAEYPWW